MSIPILLRSSSIGMGSNHHVELSGIIGSKQQNPGCNPYGKTTHRGKPGSIWINTIMENPGRPTWTPEKFLIYYYVVVVDKLEIASKVTIIHENAGTLGERSMSGNDDVKAAEAVLAAFTEKFDAETLVILDKIQYFLKDNDPNLAELTKACEPLFRLENEAAENGCVKRILESLANRWENHADLANIVSSYFQEDLGGNIASVNNLEIIVDESKGEVS